MAAGLNPGITAPPCFPELVDTLSLSGDQFEDYRYLVPTDAKMKVQDLAQTVTELALKYFGIRRWYIVATVEEKAAAAEKFQLADVIDVIDMLHCVRLVSAYKKLDKPRELPSERPAISDATAPAASNSGWGWGDSGTQPASPAKATSASAPCGDQPAASATESAGWGDSSTSLPQSAALAKATNTSFAWGDAQSTSTSSTQSRAMAPVPTSVPPVGPTASTMNQFHWGSPPPNVTSKYAPSNAESGLGEPKSTAQTSMTTLQTESIKTANAWNWN